jgi:hypothetical protein
VNNTPQSFEQSLSYDLFYLVSGKSTVLFALFLLALSKALLVHPDHAISGFLKESGNFELFDLTLAQIIDIHIGNRMEVILRSISIDLYVLHLELVHQKPFQLLKHRDEVVDGKMWTLFNILNSLDNVLLFILKLQLFLFFLLLHYWVVLSIKLVIHGLTFPDRRIKLVEVRGLPIFRDQFRFLLLFFMWRLWLRHRLLRHHEC